MRISLRYDMRQSVDGAPLESLYEAALDQCEWADKLGFSSVLIGEHHGAEDNYLPSSMIMASAVASRTKQIEIHLSALLVTMHHPLRLAEDLAVLDLISNGRVHITAGMGYRPHEFEMMGVDFKNRLKIYLSTIDVLQKAWTGEPFESEGRTVRVSPRPSRKPGPLLYMGGSGEKSAERAAKMGLGFRPGTPELYETYREAWRKAGRGEAAPFTFPKPIFLYVANDPDAAWRTLFPYVMHATNTYAKWATERKGGATTYRSMDAIEEFRSNPLYQVVTPDECVAYAKGLGKDGELAFQPLFGGLAPDVAWNSLKLFESDVLPKLKAEGLR